MPVVGMGGYFFRAKDPKAVKAWYREHLGVGAGCAAAEGHEPDQWSWYVESGPMVFEPMREDTDHFPAEKQAMINLRVRDIASLLASLEAAGIPIVVKEGWDTPETGRFAHINDPEGNVIELWEPPAE